MGPEVADLSGRTASCGVAQFAGAVFNVDGPRRLPEKTTIPE